MLDYRYIARLIIKATTPLFVGSGNSSLLVDALVQKDNNGLPMIPGTSLTGVLRHSLIDSIEQYSDEYFQLTEMFGFQFFKKDEKDAYKGWAKKNECENTDGKGSRLRISNAYLLLGDDPIKIAEGISDSIDPNILGRFVNLPNRQHVAINGNGAAIKHGLFDNEIVYQGATFIFELELKGTENDKEIWKKLIDTFNQPGFRIGQGTRKGYGNIQVTKIYQQTFNLTDKSAFNSYLDFNHSLNAALPYGSNKTESDSSNTTYTLNLTPDSFFIFGQGYGDEQTDSKPIEEDVIFYDNNNISFKIMNLIPASSIKGALAHRVCFHYNKIKGHYADAATPVPNVPTGEHAVETLFGSKAGKKENIEAGSRGNVIIDDLYYDNFDNSKIINHVAIDRFTGGALDGALFNEKVSSIKKNESIKLKVYLLKQLNDAEIINALEKALADICSGLLPLGGMTTKGHGMFTGSLSKNDKTIFDYQKIPLKCEVN
jgi:CRISPR/Cas system CSM-associated protein Csm3 (group 7 of RAMP superfamily)